MIEILLWLCANLSQKQAVAETAKDSSTPSSLLQTQIIYEHGVPILTVHGKPTAPLIFFFNTEMDRGQENLEPQVKCASAADIHLFSMPFDGWHWEWEGTVADDEQAFAWTNGILERFLKIDPKAKFLPRLRATPPWNWPGNEKIPTTERYISHEGELGPPSIGSDVYWEHFIRNLRRFVRYYEHHPYSDRFLGYHIGGPTDIEWFQWKYRETGPDYSQANITSFRRWLKEHYSTDEALAKAWQQNVTFATAQVPKFDPERFPMRMQWQPSLVQAFYALPQERDWVDYSKYVSETTASRICEAAKIIKEESSGNKLSAFFYGYSLELIGSFSGHNATEKVLACPDVDILVAPVSYIPMQDRLSGGAAAAMSAVDSVAIHGKLWLNEDDMRTHLIAEDELPKWLSFEAFGESTKSLFDTKNLLSRNLGFAYVHRAGTWWMDLIAAGAFDNGELWRDVMKKTGLFVYDELYSKPSQYVPEVAVVIDENSWHYVRSSYDIFVNCGALLRNNLEKTGTSIGYYSLGDFLNDLVPPAKAYVFPNLFYIDADTCERMLKKLDEQQATAIWHYASGILTSRGIDKTSTSRLTGFHVDIRDGITGSTGKGRLEGLTWGWTNGGTVSPRLVIQDIDTDPIEVLGQFSSDGYISTARKKHGDHVSVLFADILPSRDVFRRVLRDAQCHLWTLKDAVVRTDGRLLVAHFPHAGNQELITPAGLTLVPFDNMPVEKERNKVIVKVEPCQTVWFRIVEAK